MLILSASFGDKYLLLHLIILSWKSHVTQVYTIVISGLDPFCCISSFNNLTVPGGGLLVSLVNE